MRKRLQTVASGGEKGLDVCGERPQLESCLQLYHRLHLMMGGEVSRCRGQGGLKSATGHQPRRRCQRAATLTGNVQELFTPHPPSDLLNLPRSPSTVQWS